MSTCSVELKKPEAREWKVPLNFKIGKTEIPVGLGLITLALFALATINVLTKKTATVSGIIFTFAFFIAFEISEKYNRKRSGVHAAERETFLLTMSDDLSEGKVQVRPGNVLVAVRNPHRLDHLHQALQKTNTLRQDVVVMSVRSISPADEYELNADQLFTDQERDLFTQVVAIAEKEGKTIQLLVVPGVNAFDAIVQTATNLKSSKLVTGVSSRMDTDELARRIGQAWESTPQPRHSLSLEIIPAGQPSVFVNLGPHPPRLWPEDVDMAHELWLELSAKFGAKVHHRDVVGLALRRMKKDFNDGARPEILSQVEADLSERAR